MAPRPGACPSPRARSKATGPTRSSATTTTSRASRRRARKPAASIFVTGSFWFQAAPMAAALETLGLVRDTDYLERITALGERLRSGLHERASAAGFSLRQTGPATMPLFLFDDDPDLRK